MKARKLRTKKAKLVRLIDQHNGNLPIGTAAKKMYGQDSELTRWKVVKLLAAYRAGGDPIGVYRVRNGIISAVASIPKSTIFFKTGDHSVI